MLLRASSAPSSIFTSSSWTSHLKDPCSEPDSSIHLQTNSPHSHTTPLTISEDARRKKKNKKKARAVALSDKNNTYLPPPSIQPDENRNQVVAGQIAGVGGIGGIGSAVGGFGPSRAYDSGHGLDQTHAYYQELIEANPGDALLLGNYARFLKEIVGDLGKAVEYAERAILGNPEDGNLLCLYAEMIWKSEKDGDRAKAYFERAVEAAPEDCYVMGSYAGFLWDAEAGEGEEQESGWVY